MTTTEPTVTVTGLRSGQIYYVPVGVAIKANNAEYGSTVLEDSEGRIRSERDNELYSTLAVIESPVECRRKAYKALGYIILHDTPGEELAVPLDVARNYSAKNPVRLYTFSNNPIIRLMDNQPLFSVSVRETPAEIEACLPKPEPSPTATNVFAKCMEIANAFKECAEAGQRYFEAQQNITRLMSELEGLTNDGDG